MLNKKYIQSVRADLLAYAQKRREVIKAAGDAQHLAKKAIFAMQRDDDKAASAALEESGKLLLDLGKRYKGEKELFDEGAYRAALEEWTEAELFRCYRQGEEIGVTKKLAVDSDTFIGGLCDLPGELYRYAIKAAMERNFQEVKRCHQAAEEIIGELVDMDLTGYNRTKFDQAKQALHKLEQVVYEVSMKK